MFKSKAQKLQGVASGHPSYFPHIFGIMSEAA